MQYPFGNILRLLRRKEAGKRFKTRLYHLIGINCRYTLVLVLMESIWYFPSAVRWILVIPYLGNIILIKWLRDYFSETNILKNPDENTRLMERLGNQFPDVKDKLINAWQLSKKRDPLSELAVQRFEKILPPERLFNHLYHKESPALNHSLRLKTIITILTLFIISIFLWDGFVRIMSPGRDYPVPFPWTWEVHPGNAVLKEGDSLEIRVSHTLPPHFPKSVVLITPEGKETQILNTINDSLATVLIPKPKNSFTYHFTVRRPHIFSPWKQKSSREYSVTLLKRPVLELLEFDVIPPAYTGLERDVCTGGTDRIHMLKESVLKIAGRLSLPAGEVTVQLNDQISGLKSDDHFFEGTLKPHRSGTLILNAKDTSGTALESNVSYEISLYRDEKPVLTVIDPESDILLDESLVIPWIVYLSDDFGIRSFSLETQTVRSFRQEPDSSWTENPLSVNTSEKTQTLTDIWTVKERLSPGDALNFRFKAEDNNTLTGPGITRSPVFQARFPSLTELFSRSEQQRTDTHEDLQSLQNLSSELQHKAEALREDILKKGKADWSQEETLKNLVEQQETIRESLEEIRKSLEKQLKEISEQQLFSDEVLDNMAYMQELVKDLENSELFKKMREMQEKLHANPDSRSLQSMSEELREQATKFSQALERTIQLLETLRDMELIEEGERMLAEALRKQSELLEEEKQRSSNELAKTEHDIAQSLEELLEKFKNQSGDVSEGLQKELEKFSNQMTASELNQSLQQAMEAFSKNNRNEGFQNAETSLQKMKDLLKQYQEMASGMKQANKDEILENFQHLLHHALLISEKQETIIPGTKDLKNESKALQDRLSLQNTIQESLDRLQSGLEEIARKTFFMGPRPFQEAEKARSLSAEIIAHLLEGRFHQAEQMMAQNLGQINDLTGTILGLMGQAQSSESGTGMEAFMEQLQAMAEMQGGLNQDTQGMPMPGPGNQAMDLMSQLAARQQALRRELGKLQQAMEQAGEGGGQNLKNITREMENVIRDLRQGHVSRRTLQRQRGIEQRLLDASRSIRKRELSRERESRTGDQTARSSPERLPGDLGNTESLIQSIRDKMKNADLSPEDREEMERYLDKLRETLE